MTGHSSNSYKPHTNTSNHLPTLQLEECGGVLRPETLTQNRVAFIPRFRVVDLDCNVRLTSGNNLYETTGALDMRIFLSKNYGETYDIGGHLAIRARRYLNPTPDPIILVIPTTCVDITESEDHDPRIVGSYGRAFSGPPDHLDYSLPEGYSGGLVYGHVQPGTSLGMLETEIGSMSRLKMLAGLM